MFPHQNNNSEVKSEHSHKSHLIYYHFHNMKIITPVKIWSWSWWWSWWWSCAGRGGRAATLESFMSRSLSSVFTSRDIFLFFHFTLKYLNCLFQKSHVKYSELLRLPNLLQNNFMLVQANFIKHMRLASETLVWVVIWFQAIFCAIASPWTDPHLLTQFWTSAALKLLSLFF